MSPLYALHKDSEGRIINATSTTYSFEMDKWLRSLDVRAGDRIEFGEKLERKEPRAPESIEPLALVSTEQSA